MPARLHCFSAHTIPAWPINVDTHAGSPTADRLRARRSDTHAQPSCTCCPHLPVNSNGPLLATCSFFCNQFVLVVVLPHAPRAATAHPLLHSCAHLCTRHRTPHAHAHHTPPPPPPPHTQSGGRARVYAHAYRSGGGRQYGGTRTYRTLPRAGREGEVCW